MPLRDDVVTAACGERGPAAPLLPAATLVLLREQPSGAPLVLLCERSRALAFAPGALVFPGGRVDPGDHALAADPARVAGAEALDPADAAARVTAIRETLEEAGIAVAIAPAPDAASTRRLRAAAATGTFAAGLDREGCRLRLDLLLPFARWQPEGAPRRRFDTRFYIAEDAGDACPEPDGSETTRAFWQTAEATLASVAAGAAHAIFPTRRNLERVATLGGWREAQAHVGRHGAPVIVPHVELRDGAKWLCIATDAGYPVTAEPLAGLTRE